MIVYISEEHREITVPHAKRKKLGPKRQREREREKKEAKHENSLQKLIQFPSF